MNPTARNGLLGQLAQMAVLAATLFGAVWWITSRTVVTREEFEAERSSTRASMSGLSADMTTVKAGLARIESLLMQRGR